MAANAVEPGRIAGLCDPAIAAMGRSYRSNLIPWASGSAEPQLIVLVCRRM